MDVLSVITMVLGFSMLLIGLSIYIGKTPEMVAGYDRESCMDPERLAQMVGKGLTLMGFISMATGIAGVLFGLTDVAMFGLVGVPVIGALALVLLTRGF